MALGQVTAPWHVHAAFLLLGLGWSCLSTTALTTTLAPWFERHQGRSVTLALVGASVGAIAVAPGLLALVNAVGMANGLLWAAGAGAAVVHHVGGVAQHVAPAHGGRAQAEVVFLAVTAAKRGRVEAAQLAQRRGEPLVVMVTLLLMQYTPFLAAFWGITLTVACSWIPRLIGPLGKNMTGMAVGPQALVQGFEMGAKAALGIGAACACVGFVLGITTLTGMGFKFSAWVIDVSGLAAQMFMVLDVFNWFELKQVTIFFGLLFTAAACIIMGSGVPTTPTYIILASIVAPALAGLGVPQLATHFFVFYYGVLADVTPPVALAAFAAAGIARFAFGSIDFQLDLGIAGAARAMAPDAMRVELTGVGQFFRQIAPTVLHYKVCSTFDSAPHVGNIACAIQTLHPSVDNRWVPILGGQPSLGRYCAFSNLFAAAGTGGAVYRIDRHPTMHRHPVTPMAEADLRVHLAQQGLQGITALHYPLFEADTGPNAATLRTALGTLLDNGPADLPDLPFVPTLLDLTSADQLASVGRLLWQQAQRARLLAVGPSSVAQALIAHWGAHASHPTPALAPSTGPVFAWAGSLSPITAAQVQAATSYQRIPVDAHRLAHDTDYAQSTQRAICAGLQQGHHVLAYTGPADGAHAPAGGALAAVAPASAALVARVARLQGGHAVGQAGALGLGQRRCHQHRREQDERRTGPHHLAL